MLVLMVVGLAAIGTLNSAGDGEQAAQYVVAHRIAAARADLGVQAGIARVKTGGVPGIANMVHCRGPDGLIRGDLHDAGVSAAACATGDIVTGGLEQVAVTTNDLVGGQGMRYQYWIFRGLRPDGQPENSVEGELVHVYAEGYYGVNANGTNFTVSAVEAEVLVPRPTGVNRSGGYSRDGSGFDG